MKSWPRLKQDKKGQVAVAKAFYRCKTPVRPGRRRRRPALEFKRSTGELKEAMQTLCAFLNGAGGTLLFGVRPDGRIEGQQVSDQTLRDIAQAADRFEPPADFTLQRIRVGPGREVLAVDGPAPPGHRAVHL